MSVDLKQLEHGLHIISCISAKPVGEQEFPVKHYGVLDIGNTAGLSSENNAPALLIHQTPPEIDVREFDYAMGSRQKETPAPICCKQQRKAFRGDMAKSMVNETEGQA